MPAIHFTEAATLDDLRKEFVADLRQKATAAEAEARDAKNNGDKTKAQRVAREMSLLADHWANIHLGHPLRGRSA